ncbi:apolipoprotein L3-like isoform X1 [Ostrea edulis]|uniref:apolipoprotein L3-like isoform X1 n=1 Tax=Ostrea edulis TaxID=37623 RepID=UPI0024AF39E6|nr:apolipoprotein L3-like isoform X1 [Ostrea edulis]XP_048753824.2 apolipoprotein L3-like isoform X1 [Ostrea edulis]XP_048753825.2 apolipoprotein L3-like isoform X1 [Ostrea edulis]XP_048753826.2 apolipoprotein L3-like isoform X1 [Ostrea edulis]XP_048753827.2 apolipoprotein L3-like isoform X1 [Ostrea edulis]
MEKFKSFKAAKTYFSNTWAPERKQVIAELTSIKDEVQRQAKIHSVGSITYSSVGLVGGGLAIAGIVTAPFTFGVSLGLTVAGIATGVTSGVAGVAHGVVKFGIVKSKCNEAKTSLENHNTSSKKMKRLVGELVEEVDEFKLKIKGKNEFEISQIWDGMKRTGSAVMLGKRIYDLVVNSRAADVYRRTGNADEVDRILSLSSELGDLLPSEMKDVSKGAAKLSAEALSVVAAIGIVIDLGSLIHNAVDLSKMEKGKLCSEAKKLEEVIKILEEEYDELSKFFN